MWKINFFKKEHFGKEVFVVPLGLLTTELSDPWLLLNTREQGWRGARVGGR